ncbi:MAG: thioesterase family protein [Ardenticatenaceae bacterium]|nr:thioesterase family protein [Ardenticatenaceae bacterium]
MKDHLSGFSVIIEQAVAWGEMDAMGHVNNTVYFRYFETARLVYIEQLGGFGWTAGHGVGPILAKIDCRFRLPLTYPDTISIGVKVIEMGSDRFKMLHRVVSHTHQKIAADGVGVIVGFDYDKQQKAPFPAEVRRKIMTLDRPGEFVY